MVNLIVSFFLLNQKFTFRGHIYFWIFRYLREHNYLFSIENTANFDFYTFLKMV